MREIKNVTQVTKEEKKSQFYPAILSEKGVHHGISRYGTNLGRKRVYVQ
jgi:hypothetical protein